VNDKITRMQKHFIILFLLITVLSSCNAAPKGEVEFKLPEGFEKIYHKNKENGSFDKEYVPEGQTLANWDQIIRYIYQPVKGDLREQFSELVKLLANSCEEPFAPQPFSGKLGGYNSINAMFACGSKSGASYGEITQYIFVHGENGIYSLQRAKRISKFKTDETNKIIKKEFDEEWNEFFSSVKFKSK